MTQLRHAPDNLSFSRFKVTPSDRAIGADLHIDDVQTLDETAIREIKKAAVAYQVVRIRGQELGAAAVVHFAKRIGDPTVRGQETDEAKDSPRRDNKLTDDRFPEIGAVSNIVENGAPQGAYGNKELFWHSDMVTREKPASFTVLYAVEAPSGEGQTVFTSVTLAAETLPAERLAELSELSLKNSGAANAAGLVEGFDEITDVTTSPGRVHPLISAHPETGRPALFLGRRMHAYITGLPVEESEKLLDEIWAHATQERFQWEQDWRPGDLVIFDNRGVLHRRNPFSPEKRRLLQQIVLRGEHPVIRWRPAPRTEAA
jgi:taurine dioxygenase